MIFSYLVYFSFCVFTVFTDGNKDEISQWRGPNRDGKFPATNLLKNWPVDGPGLIWSFEGLGEGHGNVGIGNNRLYSCGMIDSTGHLFSFDLDGNLLWDKSYGLEWHKDYTGVRSTPTVIGDLVYFESGYGVVFCYDGKSGTLIWSVDLLKKFNAENIQWGMAESLLVDGDKIICTPGGREHNVVALNRLTGETIWTSKGNGQPAAYCSPILVEHQDTRLIVTTTAESIIGIDAETGAYYWSIEHRQTNFIHANTPLYHDGKIMCSSAENKSGLDGTVLVQLSDDGKNASVVWRNTNMTNLMGGFILKNGYVYGSKYRSSEWYCLNWNTGEVQYISKPFRNGVIIYADDLYYCYSEGGDMALVSADQNNFEVISQFKITLGTNQHWAHPVIDEGKLYVRHGNALMAYDIQEP
jgi:outer membrane protein assembly factor BamB